MTFNYKTLLLFGLAFVLTTFCYTTYISSGGALTIAAESKGKVDNVGRAPFGLTATSPKFNCIDFLNSLNKVRDLNIAFLYNTFGNNFDCAKSVLQDPRLRRLEVHLINEPCVRNKRCGKYEFLYGMSTQVYSRLLRRKDAALKVKFIKYVRKLQDLLAGYLQPETMCFISPGLESNVTDKRAIMTLASWTREAFPQCNVVWNPLGNLIYTAKERKLLGVDYIEHHGSTPTAMPPCITNLDGTDINFEGVGRHTVNPINSIHEKNLASYIKSNLSCEMVFLWGAEDNGFNYSSNEPWADPRNRPFTVGRFNRLVAPYIEQAQKLMKPEAPSPVWTDEEKLSLVGCKKTLSSNDGVKRGFVWKQSDAHPGVAILLTAGEEKVTALTLWNKGRKIYTFFRAGTFGEDQWGNRPLWRSPDVRRLDITTLPYHSVLKGEPGNICRPIDNPKTRND